MKVMFTRQYYGDVMTPLLLSLKFFLLIAFSSCASDSVIDRRITIVPNGFRGVVLIVQDTSKNKDLQTQKGEVVYRVPSSGILRIAAPVDRPFKDDRYYFENPDGTLAEIRYLYPGGGAWAEKEITFDNVPRDSDEMFCMMDSFGTFQNAGKTISYRSFAVGRASEVDRLDAQIMEKLRGL